MELSKELAQAIVDRTSKIVDYTINIMNTQGIIIASNDATRLGEVHEGAKKVLISLNSYIIDEEEAKKYSHVVPGISLPVKFYDKILGVVGIGSGSASALSYGQFIQFTTELLLEQAFLKEKMMHEGHAINNFLRRLLQFPWSNDEPYFLHQVTLHNFNIYTPYLIAITEIREDFFSSHSESYDSAISNQERTINKLIHTLSTSLHYSDMHILSITNNIAFMVPMQPIHHQTPSSFIKKFSEDLDFILSQLLSTSYRIGIGGIAEDLKDIHRLYKHAFSSLMISRIFNYELKTTVFMDTYLEYLLLSIPGESQKKFYRRILGPLLDNGDKNEQWIKTLKVFYKNNKSLLNTANALYIHRNSLLFRLNRIHDLTGFHPQNYRDSVYLYIALIFWQLDHSDKKLEDIIKLNQKGVSDEF